MLGVSKQTLIYYDKIGLISPEKRNDKEYRYYTLEQADELDSILTFRNLRVPIDTLKGYFSARNPEGCIQMLKKQRESVDSEIKKLERVRRKIERRSRLFEQVLAVQSFEKVEFSMKNKEYYLIEPCIEDNDKTYMESFFSICNRSKDLQIEFENPICSIITHEDFINGCYHNTTYLGIKIPEDFIDNVDDKVEKPQGIYASTYHKGSYSTKDHSYERLIKCINEQGYKVCGDAYEIDLLSTLTNADHDEDICLINIQVCR